MSDRPTHDPVIVLFDGVCNLCSGLVRWVIARDPKRRVVFGSLQSERGGALRRAFGVPDDSDTVVLIVAGHAYTHSDAAIRLGVELGRPWSLVRAALLLPRPLRDICYRYVASHRYRWFGRTDECWIPTPELRARFLPDEPSKAPAAAT